MTANSPDSMERPSNSRFTIIEEDGKMILRQRGRFVMGSFCLFLLTLLFCLLGLFSYIFIVIDDFGGLFVYLFQKEYRFLLLPVMMVFCCYAFLFIVPFLYCAVLLIHHSFLYPFRKKQWDIENKRIKSSTNILWKKWKDETEIQSWKTTEIKETDDSLGIVDEADFSCRKGLSISNHEINLRNKDGRLVFTIEGLWKDEAEWIVSEFRKYKRNLIQNRKDQKMETLMNRLIYETSIDKEFH